MEEPVGSPLWWVHRLEHKLHEQRQACARFGAYYTGNHPLPEIKGATDKHRDVYRQLVRNSRSNWMGLVIDTVAERLRVDGFRLGDDPSGDSLAWYLWQANNLDSDSEMVHTVALINGRSYGIVWFNPDNPDVPLMTVEHPSQMVMATDSGTRRRLAALKVWQDEWTAKDHATLYLPDGIYKYVATRADPYASLIGATLDPYATPNPWNEVQRLPSYSAIVMPTGVQTPSRWAPRDVTGEPWPIPNPLGFVPVVEFRNRPLMLTGGRSEIEDLIDIQNRINATLFGRLMATEFAAFPQKWATGLDVPVGPDGAPVEPFHVAVDRLIWSSDPDTKFGQFPESNLTGYGSAVEADVQHLAAISHTPPHYVLGTMINISGDALTAAEAGLVAKAIRRQTHFGEAHEAWLRLAFRIAGDDARANVTNAETIWKSPQFRSEAEVVDAVVKLRSIGMPLEMCFERIGLSPVEIGRAMIMIAEEQLTAGALLAPELPVAA